MPRHDHTETILGIFGMLFYLAVAVIVIAIWFPGIAGYWEDAIGWCSDFLSGLIPTGTGMAGAVAWALGTVMVLAVLAAAYFTTGMAGRRQPSGAHGVSGVMVGFTVLIFTAASLYSSGFKFSVALLGGIAASVLLKLLFAYWRTRLHGSVEAAPRTVQVSYRRQVIRRE